MPLYKTINPNSQTTVKIWKITETYNQLLEPLTLTQESKARVEGMKSVIHQRGFLSIRHLLRDLNYTDKDLYYDQNGKPHLRDGKHISITHSFNYSAVVISNQPVGIDIEKQRQKITRIAKKFIGYESQYLNTEAGDYVKKLTVIWCVKESLYKLYATPGLSFKQHTLVIPFMLEDETTTSWIDYDTHKMRFKADYFEFENFTCAYALNG